MPKIDETTKSQRLERLFLLLARNSMGSTEAELAQETRLHRRSINNYLRELENHGKAYKEGIYWYPLVLKDTRLKQFELTPEEMVTLYLGARLLVKQHDKRNEIAETALLKLANALQTDAGTGREIEQAAKELANLPVQEGYQPIFRTVVRGYVYRKKVELIYRPLHWQRPFTTRFSTYLIEPSALGYTTYLIGNSSIVDELRAYKLDRIISAQITNESYDIPHDFPGLAILRNAWNIITGEETVNVKLRFSPQVRERVLETRWHPSQQPPEEDLDYPGYLIWRAQVANTLDMLPWIKSWGADIEVLEPEILRKDLRREASRLANLYHIETAGRYPPHHYLWSKTDRYSGGWHPLLYHMIDTGQVALGLWENALSDSLRLQISDWLELETEEAGKLLAFLAALHDLGKASPAFQDHPSLSSEFKKNLLFALKEAGFAFPVRSGETRARHEVITTWAVERLLPVIGLDKRAARRIAVALGGHHGSWPTWDRLGPAALKSADKGDETWDAVRRSLFDELSSVFKPPGQFHLPTAQLEQNAFLTLLSGLVTVSDWVASMEQLFQYDELYEPCLDYALRASQKAYDALESLEWMSWRPNGDRLTFTEMFDFIQEPNPIQSKAISALENLPNPGLIILEAPTGIGKTELALYLADCWLQTNDGRGLYVAMPTQATSNQMFGRVASFLENRYPETIINTHLIHGQAQLSLKMKEIRLGVIGEGKGQFNERVVAMTWFLPRKRTLLAPFGVGTVDQALMSVLQSRHFFVRLLGLSHKVVIFDEVHAYDTYMSALFQCLLGWLRAIGAPVIVLSATLPEATRRNLVAAYGGKIPPGAPSAPYPRLTIVGDGETTAISLPEPEARTIALEHIGSDPNEIAAFLSAEIRDGGCAAVICNRVARAQEIYRIIRDAKIVDDDNLILFHARFPFAWRDEIERKVLEMFGKDGERPSKAILVATQVIEQSLDLDFDLMVSDLPPIDLLLQRAGRLHRHAKNDAFRPPNLADPRLVLAKPERKDGLPDFGKDVYVYEPYILLQTWRVLKDRTCLNMPSDTSSLIETVYTDTLDPLAIDPTLVEVLVNSHNEMIKRRRKDEFIARTRLIPSADDEDLLAKANLELDEEDPDIHEAFRAMTRLIEPSVYLVCLYLTPQGLALEPDGTGAPIDPEKKPSRSLTVELVKRAVAVQRREVVQYFRSQQPPVGWKDEGALRYHHLAVFEGGCCKLEGAPFDILLDRNIGIEIQSSGKRKEVL